MHSFFIKPHWLIQKYFSSYIWKKPPTGNKVYLTFDDGPHPEITPFVLDLLKEYNAKATFFCIGENVAAYPGVYKQIIEAGHSVGNHTYHHFNGWHTPVHDYLDDVAKAVPYIDSNLFRPPYGRILKKQALGLPAAMKREDVQVIMWDVLSADFDTSVSPDKCLKNVLRNTEAGSIIVFHDSEKAFKNLEYTLPKVLQVLQERCFQFEKL